jgi:hypothetical protein
MLAAGSAVLRSPPGAAGTDRRGSHARELAQSDRRRGRAPDPDQKPTPEQQSAPGSGSVLAPDMTSVTGPHRLTFSGDNPAPNKFALMNATGFKDTPIGWSARKTVTFVPTGGSDGFDCYVLDVTDEKGALSGTLTFTRKMVLVAPDTGKDAKTMTTEWSGKVTGVMKPDGTILGKVTGSSSGDSVYIAENWPLEGSPPPPDVQPTTPFTWTFVGDY